MRERNKNKIPAKEGRSFRGHILTNDEIKAFAAHMRKFMGPTIAALSDEYGLRIEDTLRFQPLASRLADVRTERGLTLRDVASSLKVPKYRLDYIEKASMKNIDPELASRYIEFLGLTRWFGRWKKAHAELAGRMGFSIVSRKK